ncbi:MULTISPECIES: BLUF domain-containing protein [Psychrobacter]|uniref:FAD-dependent sensor of blue light n=1 Tax=Psychrobacter fozii TaxID=198480 RepID=A0A2V4VZA6_9GAMM|nr:MULTISPECIES: BLUF domain-containing protein [Psychrobacter]MBH0064100.1 BLUF domain-containing protein [Psychrobacter sp. SZ93C1]PYE40714.1 FAD-dependent sensor of blue light [Psychrobacter fozii]
MPLSHTDRISTWDEIEDSTLVQLVYVSSLTIASRLSASIFDEVESHARDYNQQHGITGTLCYGSGHFLQCIEGEKAHVYALKQRIFADSRHKDVEVLLLQTIEHRSFADWRMRLLFLERWLWSPATKNQATQLSPYLPFAPHGWSPDRTEQFLHIIKTFDSPPHVKAAGITYNALGNMFRHIAAPHQAFLIIQGFLSVLLVVALILLYL